MTPSTRRSLPVVLLVGLVLAGPSLLGACSSEPEAGAGGGSGGSGGSSTSSGDSTLGSCPSYSPVRLQPLLAWQQGATPCADSCTVQTVDGSAATWCEGAHWLAVVDDDSGTYAEICSSLPELGWALSPGDQVRVAWTSYPNDNDADDVSLQVFQGEQLVLFEARTVLHPIDFPSGVAFEPQEPSCEVLPEDAPCCLGLLRHPVRVTVAGSSATVEPGQSALVADHQVLVGQYDTGSGKDMPSCSDCDPYSATAIDLAVYPAVPAGG